MEETSGFFVILIGKMSPFMQYKHSVSTYLKLRSKYMNSYNICVSY